MKLRATQIEVLTLAKVWAVDVHRISHHCGIGQRSALRRLERLVRDGYLRERSTWVYVLTDKGREALAGVKG